MKNFLKIFIEFLLENEEKSDPPCCCASAPKPVCPTEEFCPNVPNVLPLVEARDPKVAG